MDLPLAWSLLLVVSAVWSFVIWPPFLRRVLKDERSREVPPLGHTRAQDSWAEAPDC